MEHYSVTGMSCAACSSRVEKAVSKVDGVTECTVSLLTNSMTVEGTAAPETIIQAVKDAGYGATQKDKAAGKQSRSQEDEMSEIGDQNIEKPPVFIRCFFAFVDVSVDGTYDVGLAIAGIFKR